MYYQRTIAKTNDTTYCINPQDDAKRYIEENIDMERYCDEDLEGDCVEVLKTLEFVEYEKLPDPIILSSEKSPSIDEFVAMFNELVSNGIPFELEGDARGVIGSTRYFWSGITRVSDVDTTESVHVSKGAIVQ